jgi:hypothetical protein
MERLAKNPRVLSFFCVALSAFTPAYADIANPGDVGGMGALFNAFSNVIRTEVWPALQATPAYAFAESLFAFFTAILLIELVFRFMMSGVTLAEVLEKIFFIALVRCLMLVYDDGTAAMWGWADAFGGSIQQAAVGTDELFFVPAFISGIMNKFSFLDLSIFDGIMVVLSLVVLSILTTILSVLSYFAVAWGVWGYTVAKLLGWMFVPLMMFKRLEFLWDGWFRFFMGFLMFTVMARVQLSLTAIIFRLYFNLPTYSAGDPLPATELTGLSDFLGVIVMIVIAICGLLSTGRFATAIAGGVGGFGGALRSVAMTAAKIA